MEQSIFNYTVAKNISIISVSAFIFLFMTFSCSHQHSHPIDIFCIDQTNNIMHSENFGIANGKITTGIEYNDLFSIKGIWAPPYVSSDFSFEASVNGLPRVQPQYNWKPFNVERYASLDNALLARTNTLLVPEGRAFIVSLLLKNQGKENLSLSFNFIAKGTLDKMLSDTSWGFTAPQSTTATIVEPLGNNSVALKQNGQAIVITASNDLYWDKTQRCFKGNSIIPPGGETKLYFAFSVGVLIDAVKQCNKIADNPEAIIKKAYRIYNQRVTELYRTLPRFESDNASLVHFYDRSLASFLLNRWDVPEFKLHPFYSTGSVRGGCVGDYLWNVGESMEILSLYDPDATKAHIRQFMEAGVKCGKGLCPVSGRMLDGKLFYPVNQEKVIGLTYHYVRNTGDVNFLNEKLGNGTVLDSIISEALFLDGMSKPIAMVDYNTCDPQHKGGHSHLELRTPIGKMNYTNVIPDLNGRRYLNYLFAARLSELTGKPRPDLLKRAEALKRELKKQLWDADKKWFVYKIPDSIPPITEHRYTVQMFYLLGSGVLDEEEESGLLGHLNENEFLSDYGMHSLAKQDPAYFQPDVDNGGPGTCTSFPLNIAKNLYIMGKPQLAENILKRLLWWGESMPYWGDSFYADTIRYREETPLQCTIDAVSGAQCIIYGMFGISPDFDGTIRVNPSLPSFARHISLKGVRLRNQMFDVEVNRDNYKVSIRGNTLEAKIGQTVKITNGKLTFNQ
jgi:hypothetical protein